MKVAVLGYEPLGFCQNTQWFAVSASFSYSAAFPADFVRNTSSTLFMRTNKPVLIFHLRVHQLRFFGARRIGGRETGNCCFATLPRTRFSENKCCPYLLSWYVAYESRSGQTTELVGRVFQNKTCLGSRF